MSMRSAGGANRLAFTGTPNLTTFSWCGWIWVAAYNASQIALFGVNKAADGTNGVGISVSSGGLLQIGTPNAGSTNGTRTVPLSTWAHTALVRDGSSHWA